MNEFPSKISTQTSTPEGAGTGTGCRKFISVAVGFVRSIVGILMIVEIVLGLLVWALISDSYYQYSPAYCWVLFVAVFCWTATIILFVIYLLQLPSKLQCIPWSIVNLAFNVAAATLYITGFITCAAAVQSTWYGNDYNKRASASFFACLVMLAYGASCFFVWWRYNRNAATSQAAGPNNA